MTREEIKKFLDNTKVYVNGKSKEIQEKLFSFGYHWIDGSLTEVCYIRSPFLFIYKNGDIAYSKDMVYFKEHEYREIFADEIISLEITEPSYRPFKTKDECWSEIQKHLPVGWLIGKSTGTPTFMQFSLNNLLFIYDAQFTYEESMRAFTFADGTPFGIKED